MNNTDPAKPGAILFGGQFTRVAQVGEWGLYEGIFSGPVQGGQQVATGTNGELILTNNSAAAINVDDIRMQPADAQMNCYVYDARTLRPIATFDDQHFGLLYQYNAEGQLIRQQKETERGVKTLQETLYRVPEVAR